MPAPMRNTWVRHHQVTYRCSLRPQAFPAVSTPLLLGHAGGAAMQLFVSQSTTEQWQWNDADLHTAGMQVPAVAILPGAEHLMI